MEHLASPIKLIGAYVYRTREALNNDTLFMDKAKKSKFKYITGKKFNLWHYPGTPNEISNTLINISKTPDGNRLKFPAVFNFMPIEQRFDGEFVFYTFNLAFVARVQSEWTTEQREAFVFEPILRPLYREFMQQLGKSKSGFVEAPYGNVIPHRAVEVYTTGNNMNELIKGRYSDYIDAIEVQGLTLKIKNLCDSDLELIEEQNSLIV